jgi:acyl dehydratase
MHNGGTMPNHALHPISLEFSARPSNGLALLRSLFAGRPAQVPLEQLDIAFEAKWDGAHADVSRVRQYHAVCGLRDNGTLPPLYLHAMAMPLHMAILSHAAFPLKLLGLVHLSNSMDILRPIASTEVLTMQCSLQAITPTDRGQSFTITTTLNSGSEQVWTETSTFLSPLPPSQRKKTRAAAEDAQTDWGAPLAQWQVAGNAGRQFAGPSGDWNPIHVSAITARLFGYRSAIGHGMYSAARSLQVLQQEQGQVRASKIELRFKRPLPIPGAVALHAMHELTDTSTQRFLLRVQANGEPHIEGRVQWDRA